MLDIKPSQIVVKIVNVGWVEVSKPNIFERPQENQIETSIISYASRLKYVNSKTPTLQLLDFR